MLISVLFHLMDVFELLPQDIIYDILMNIPYTSYNSLMQSSQELRDVMQNESFYKHKIMFGKSEKF